MYHAALQSFVGMRGGRAVKRGDSEDKRTTGINRDSALIWFYWQEDSSLFFFFFFLFFTFVIKMWSFAQRRYWPAEIKQKKETVWTKVSKQVGVPHKCCRYVPPAISYPLRCVCIAVINPNSVKKHLKSFFKKVVFTNHHIDVVILAFFGFDYCNKITA